MHRPFVAFSLAALVAGSVYAASAFDAADTGTRALTATVVTDADGYLALAARAASAHASYVSVSANKVTVSFAGNANGGDGVNAGSIYYFDDILQVTNQGTATVFIQVVSASTSGTVKACHATATGAMTNTCYLASAPATPVSIAVGVTHYIGVSMDASSLSSGSVSGTIKVVACRTSAC